MAEEKIIVVAEDDKSVGGLYKALLMTFLPEARVYLCPNGEEALVRIRKRGVDLLLTDYKMPVMDGLELAREAKKINPELKIIMVSGTPPPLAVAQEAGVDSVLTKPAENLAGEIKKMLDLCPV